MKTNDKKNSLQSTGLKLAALALVLIAVGFFVAGRASNREPEVAQRWALYVQDLTPESKLVVLSSLQHYEASKAFTRKLLAVVKVRATVELSAWADVSYYFDLDQMEKWSVRYDKKSGVLEVRATEPKCLPPAVRTETIEIHTKGGNLVTNTVLKLKEQAAAMEDELSSDLVSRAEASLTDKAVREGIRQGLTRTASKFCASALKIQPKEIRVALPGD
jgi:hypothetical protein